MIIFGIAEHLLHDEKRRGLRGQMLPKYFSQLLFNSGSGEFQIMHTEQHGLL